MNISAEDIKTYATDIKVATERVVATRKGLTDYQNALLELYEALDKIDPLFDDEHQELQDTLSDLFTRVSEMVSLDEAVYFGNKEEQNVKDVAVGLNEIAESGGIKDSEEDM